MKKIIGIMLLLVALMNASALAEGFTLHNGTQFGMTKEEVIRIEKEHSFDLIQGEYTDGQTYLFAIGKIAGFNGELLYEFSNNSLNHMWYRFGSNEAFTDRNTRLSHGLEYFVSIENGLKSKYGDTKYNSSTLLAVPSFEEGIPFVSSENYKIHEYSHRFIEIGTNEYVFIGHYLYEWIVDGTTLSFFYDRVDYHYLDAASSKNLFDQLNQQQNDL